MNKKSATKISILLFSIFSCLFLFSCANEDKDYTPSKEELYKSMIGTWIFEETDETGNVQFCRKITITEKDFKNVKTIKEMRKTNEGSKNNKAKQSVIETINRYSLADYDLCSYSAYEIGTRFGSAIKSFLGYKIYNEKLHIVGYSCSDVFLFHGLPGIKYYQVIYRLDKSTSEDNNTGSSITDSDLLGSYTISEANGSTFNFSSDGTWTYKYNSRTTKGSWSVSDGKISITYSLGGYSSTAKFTADISGDTYTLKGIEGDYTTIISSAFKITNQTALEKGVVTLVKQ